MKSNFLSLNQDYGLIGVSGEEAGSFLQGQLTCDIRELGQLSLSDLDPRPLAEKTQDLPVSCLLGAECNLAGRIFALYRIFIHEGAYCLQLPKALTQAAIERLKKYALFSKVQIDDVSHQWMRMGLVDYSLEKLQKNFEPKLAQNLLPKIKHIVFPGLEQNPKIQLIGSPEDMRLLLQALEKFITPMDFNTWTFLDIQQGIPEVWLESSEQFLPHHLNLDQLGAVSFTKGCYRGQEIVARMEYRGKIKRKLIQATLRSEEFLPLPAQMILPSQTLEQHSGRVVSAAFAEDRASIAVLMESTV